MKTEVISAIVEVTSALAGNKEIKSMLCGEYCDGEPRSIPDAIRGEVLSPKQKKKVKDYKKAKKKKRKKKKKGNSLIL